jgi:hypothetical protein
MSRHEYQNQVASNVNAKQNSAGPAEDGIKINGLQQVVDLLRFADPAFRDSLLKRLMARDPKLAQQLRQFIR